MSRSGRRGADAGLVPRVKPVDERMFDLGVALAYNISEHPDIRRRSSWRPLISSAQKP